ncbi:MAG: T9SS type A sorting domain-containing protein [Chitinophagales bacterium]
MIKSYMMKKASFLKIFYTSLILFFITTACKSQNATFTNELTGFSLEGETAFNYATDLWGNYLISDVPIKIIAHFTFLLPGQLGITFPNGELNFTDAPINNVWFASSLANAISGLELNPGEADMEIYLNASVSWYFGLDGNPGPGQYDFVSTVLHEVCHGLGFLSLANKIVGEGSFGLIDASAFAPLTTTFPWPDLDTLPSIFDYYLETEGGARLVTFENPSDELATEFTGSSVYFSSPSVIEDNGGFAGRIYAPSTFALGSSLSHWNEGTYPVGNPNELMTPQAAPGHSSFTPGPLTLALLDDIGWEINYDTATAISEWNSSDNFNIYPNPVSDILFIESDVGNYSIQIFNYEGKPVTEYYKPAYPIDISFLSDGIYLLTIWDKNKKIFFSKTIVKF